MFQKLYLSFQELFSFNIESLTRRTLIRTETSGVAYLTYRQHISSAVNQRFLQEKLNSKPASSSSRDTPRTPRKQLQVAFPNPFHCEAPPNEAYKYYQIIRIFRYFLLSLPFSLTTARIPKKETSFCHYQSIEISANTEKATPSRVSKSFPLRSSTK